MHIELKRFRLPLIGAALFAGAASMVLSAFAQINPPPEPGDAQRAATPPKIVGWAVIEPDGAAHNYKNLTGNIYPARGTYFLTFNRRINKCSYSAASQQFVIITVTPSGSNPKTINVETFNLDGVHVDLKFYVQVFC